MTARPNELTAVEAARRIEAGDLTVEALVRACLERIDEREPDIAAWAHRLRAAGTDPEVTAVCLDRGCSRLLQVKGRPGEGRD